MCAQPAGGGPIEPRSAALRHKLQQVVAKPSSRPSMLLFSPLSSLLLATQGPHHFEALDPLVPVQQVMAEPSSKP